MSQSITPPSSGVPGVSSPKATRTVDGSKQTASGPATPLPPSPDSGDKDAHTPGGQPALVAPRLNAETLILLLQQLNLQTLDTQMAGEENTIKVDSARLKSRTQQNIKRIQDMAKKLAEKKKGGLAAKIFGWIAAALAVIASAIVAVVSFGAGSALVGAAALASAAIVVTVSALNETGAMNKIVQGIAKAIEGGLVKDGVDAKEAKKIAGIIAQVSVAVVIAAIQIGLAVATGGASTAQITNQFARLAANLSLKTASIMASVSTVGGGASNVAAGALGYEAADVQARRERDKALIAKMQAALEAEQDTIHEIIQLIEQGQDSMTEIVRANHQSHERMINMASAV